MCLNFFFKDTLLHITKRKTPRLKHGVVGKGHKFSTCTTGNLSRQVTNSHQRKPRVPRITSRKQVEEEEEVIRNLHRKLNQPGTKLRPNKSRINSRLCFQKTWAKSMKFCRIIRVRQMWKNCQITY